MAEYGTCPRCGTTTMLTSCLTKSTVRIYSGTCKECKNKVIKEVPK